ncbi:MAG: hypothetical protein JNM24_06730 [Bdellovibrionaceae bacterium]|nr:hypothetical protein [Pseudobdellovibrionaceae bacterium]
MKKYFSLFYILFVCLSVSAQSNDIEAEFTKINNDLKKIARELTDSYKKNDKPALLSFRIEQKTEPVQRRYSEFKEKHPQYKDKFKPAIDEINSIIDLINKRKEDESKADTSVAKNTKSKSGDTPKECTIVFDALNAAITSLKNTDGPSKDQMEIITKASSKASSEHPECKGKILSLQKQLLDALSAKMAIAKTEANGVQKPVANEKIEILDHATLKERLDIGPYLTVGKTYKVNSLFGELYDGLCKPMFHRGGKVLCDDVESLIKNINFEFKTQEAKTNFYRKKKNFGCFTFEWTNYDKLKITDYQVGACN